MSNPKYFSKDLYPFIFARLHNPVTAGCNGATPVIKDWVVIIALPDYKMYDSRWMNDPEHGEYCLVPDVDISYDKDTVFATFDEAKFFVANWWKKQLDDGSTD